MKAAVLVKSSVKCSLGSGSVFSFQQAFFRSRNAAVARSPGLALCVNPGKNERRIREQPQRGCVSDWATTLSGLTVELRCDPKVAALWQPWAGGLSRFAAAASSGIQTEPPLLLENYFGRRLVYCVWTALFKRRFCSRSMNRVIRLLQAALGEQANHDSLSFLLSRHIVLGIVIHDERVRRERALISNRRSSSPSLISQLQSTSR